MDSDEQEIDYHPNIEPDIIIDDSSSDEDGYYEDAAAEAARNELAYRLQQRIGPEVSLIPVRKSAGPIKIKMFAKMALERQSLPTPPPPSELEIHKIRRIMTRAPRQAVRLVSPEEMIRAETLSVTKRRSLPLEKCPICKKFFRRMKTHLQKHENAARDPNDPLTCRYCMKVFNTGSNLSIHMRTHTGDKPYVCEVCTKGFAQSCNLINHMRIHTGERPFKCPHCDRAFTQSGNLSNHVRLHTDEKPFVCHFCDKAFTQSGNLNSHIRNNHKFMYRVGDISFESISGSATAAFQ